ncbi:MAG: hypothetical protein AABY32_00595 [Nanoarchaeota archaeon]
MFIFSSLALNKFAERVISLAPNIKEKIEQYVKTNSPTGKAENLPQNAIVKIFMFLESIPGIDPYLIKAIKNNPQHAAKVIPALLYARINVRDGNPKVERVTTPSTKTTIQPAKPLVTKNTVPAQSETAQPSRWEKFKNFFSKKEETPVNVSRKPVLPESQSNISNQERFPSTKIQPAKPSIQMNQPTNVNYQAFSPSNLQGVEKQKKKLTPEQIAAQKAFENKNKNVASINNFIIISSSAKLKIK